MLVEIPRAPVVFEMSIDFWKGMLFGSLMFDPRELLTSECEERVRCCYSFAIFFF